MQLYNADSSRAIVSYWWKYVHYVLVNLLGGLSLTRNGVSRLTDSTWHDLNSADWAVKKPQHNQSANQISWCLTAVHV